MLAKILTSLSLEKRVSAIKTILQSTNLDINHPDVLYLPDGIKLGVDQVKKIQQFLAFKPLQSSGKGVVIATADNFTVDAQNALLKTLEELPETAFFLIGISVSDKLLPTVLSRCLIIDVFTPTTIASSSNDQDIQQLINSTLSERFIYIEKTKDKHQLFKDLVIFFRQSILAGNTSPHTVSFINELLEAEKWIKQNVSIRPILEYLMIIMPEIT